MSIEDREKNYPKGIQKYEGDPQEVRNPYSGESVTIPADAIAVYDWIKGSELFNQYDDMRIGLDWFRQYEPEAYMVLLD
jgi:hypothetical protein